MRWPLSFVLALAICSPARLRADAPLKFEDAVHEALGRNERARKTPLRVDAAEGSLDRARFAFVPTLGLSGVSSFVPGKAVSDVATVTLGVPLLSPSAFPLYGQAKHSLESETWGAEQDRRQLAFDAARAFLQTLSAERVRDAAQRRIDTAKANLDDAEARFKAELVGSNDVTRAKIDLASAKSAWVSANANVQRAYITLGFLMGRTLTPGLAAPVETTKSARTYDPNKSDYVAAIDRRPDVRSTHEHTESLRDFAREPLYRMIPTLSAAGSVKLDPSPPSIAGGGAGKTVDESLTLNLTWAIFDGGFRYADRKTRLAQLESAALDESLLKRSVDTDIRLALTSLHAARDTLKIAEEAVVTAQKSVDETAALYHEGLAKAIELTDANLNRFDAEITRESAQIAMELAYMDLRQALGYGPLDEMPKVVAK
jgi:outer membrane protein TolC